MVPDRSLSDNSFTFGSGFLNTLDLTLKPAASAAETYDI
jgi:hypothetical protein